MCGLIWEAIGIRLRQLSNTSFVWQTAFGRAGPLSKTGQSAEWGCVDPHRQLPTSAPCYCSFYSLMTPSPFFPFSRHHCRVSYYVDVKSRYFSTPLQNIQLDNWRASVLRGFDPFFRFQQFRISDNHFLSIQWIPRSIESTVLCSLVVASFGFVFRREYSLHMSPILYLSSSSAIFFPQKYRPFCLAHQTQAVNWPQNSYSTLNANHLSQPNYHVEVLISSGQNLDQLIFGKESRRIIGPSNPGNPKSESEYITRAY